MGAADDAKIQSAPAANLYSPFPIKVFISTGLDVKAQDNFLRRVADWQKKDEKKHGSIELVLTRDETMTPVGADKNAGQPLWETFKNLLRQRADEIKKESGKVK